MSLLRLLFASSLLFLGPILFGIVVGFIQVGGYRLATALGAVKREDVPIFPILFLRGMMVLLALVAVHVFYFASGGKRLIVVEWWQALFS
ncbi:MAG: hypothetical protein H0W72_04925 [Planctomycetes bacterium]|nr:hypothetical protein [Planctomycetota bacterium]